MILRGYFLCACVTSTGQDAEGDFDPSLVPVCVHRAPVWCCLSPCLTTRRVCWLYHGSSLRQRARRRRPSAYFATAARWQHGLRRTRTRESGGLTRPSGIVTPTTFSSISISSMLWPPLWCLTRSSCEEKWRTSFCCYLICQVTATRTSAPSPPSTECCGRRATRTSSSTECVVNETKHDERLSLNYSWRFL